MSSSAPMLSLALPDDKPPPSFGSSSSTPDPPLRYSKAHREARSRSNSISPEAVSADHSSNETPSTKRSSGNSSRAESTSSEPAMKEIRSTERPTTERGRSSIERSAAGSPSNKSPARASTLRSTSTLQRSILHSSISSSGSLSICIDGRSDSKHHRVRNPLRTGIPRPSSISREAENDQPATPTSAGSSIRSSFIDSDTESAVVSENEDEDGYVGLNIPPTCQLPPFINTDCGCRLSHPARSCRDHVSDWEAFLEAMLPPKPVLPVTIRFMKARDKHRALRNERLAEMRKEQDALDALAEVVKKSEIDDDASIATAVQDALARYVSDSQAPHLENMLRRAGRSSAEKRMEERNRERAERYEREEDQYVQLILKKKKEELSKEEADELRYLRRRLRSRQV